MQIDLIVCLVFTGFLFVLIIVDFHCILKPLTLIKAISTSKTLGENTTSRPMSSACLIEQILASFQKSWALQVQALQ